MSQPKRPFTGNRLRTLPKIKPLDPNVRLAPYRVPAPPPAKFDHVQGQTAMDFSQDECDGPTD
jgi:hypothetical protein